MSMKERKLLLIGWDAADWQVIEPLLAAGEMPTLKSFINQGVRGNIASLSPTLSPILWSSIATGKRAYDHGICGFVEHLATTDRVVPVRSTNRKCKALWNILNEAGLKTNVVNWWPSHPAEKIDGVCVSNQFHLKPPPVGEPWPASKAVVSPENLEKLLHEFRVHPAELQLTHLIPFIPKAAQLNPEKDPILKAVMRILAHCSSIHNVTTWLMEHTEWDFMAVYQEAIDHFSHLAMRFHPPRMEGIDPEEFERYKDVVSAAYQFHDMMLERLLQLAGPDCDVILLSDHGYHSGVGRIDNLPDIPAAPALEHRKYGIFVASGPSFKEGIQLYGSSLLDITPTILHHFGLPVGEDMEGQVQLDIYPTSSEVGAIPSWENTKVRPEFLEDLPDADQNILHQLEEIGYVDLPHSDKEEYIRRELLYNRNLSLLEGGRYEQVVKEISDEWSLHQELRFGLLLAQAYQNLQDLDRWEDVLSDMARRHPGNGVVSFELGMLALARSDAAEAIRNFNELESSGIESVQLFNEIGRSYLVTGDLRLAIKYFDKSLALDATSAFAMTGKAQALLERGDDVRASQLIESSLSLQFFQPRAHYMLAQVALNKGDHKLAMKALEICLGQAPKHDAARKLLLKLKGVDTAHAPRAIVVVSGWPRSGTSMMMHMLQAAGVEVYVDLERQPDANNPDGYFEHSKVLQIGKNNSWISEVRGKAVKVVLPLLRYLPSSENYKLIVMHRPLTEVIVSQGVMKGNKREKLMKHFPFETALKFQQEEERLTRWLDKQPHMQQFHVELDRCISDPEAVMVELQEFLGIDLKLKAAAEIPNSERQRIKLGEK